ncbi:multiheme c-type cytochrome [Selenihalanaerobacter shriftii]|uniref:Seven times multi-haem cytochrome CxxCH n=1 Tax=Selenihalanaerobacter shriftii TaxID=142842 RepID=A0A1T4LFI8_9FIRM|nr:multiheme c-type cytochrome [Selenihalanaerobacter shriftii]SJZ53475.1 Seven times multi-haem cytochrome CxxCH [Selenihalanaerobacter shriftii]
MSKKKILFTMMLTVLAIFAVTALTMAESPSDTCISCHDSLGATNGVIHDWENSKHAEVGVSCYECHKANEDDKDAYQHNGFTIATIVSPKDCGTCHSEEVKQHNNSLHADGYKFAKESALYEHTGKAAKVSGCQTCHGTKVKVLENGKLDPDTWPNNGIGRVNPDGSKGSCTACHTSHKFSVEEARKPEACAQCHLGPDHPQKEIYNESKHGAIYAMEGDEWNWDAPAEELGVDDMRAPTCATCHISGFGETEVTHNVSARLSWELERPHTDRTKNWKVKREEMQKVCTECHSTQWTKNHYKKLDETVKIYNEKFYNPYKKKYEQAKKDGVLKPGPFNDEVDWTFFEMWHHEGRRARMGAAMGGPDYVHWHGFYEIVQDVQKIDRLLDEAYHEKNN